LYWYGWFYRALCKAARRAANHLSAPQLKQAAARCIPRQNLDECCTPEISDVVIRFMSSQFR
jgi:hypothetical protein